MFLALLLLAGLGLAQRHRSHQIEEEGPKLPNSRNQREEILKADHEKDLKDAAQLVKLSEDLKIELEKNDRHVLSLSALKMTEDIEKIAKRIRGRLKRF